MRLEAEYGGHKRDHGAGQVSKTLDALNLNNVATAAFLIIITPRLEDA